MGLVSGWGAATRGGGGRNPAAQRAGCVHAARRLRTRCAHAARRMRTRCAHGVRSLGEVGKKKGVGVAKWGCLGYFFAWESTELLGTPSQMHRHVDNNLISQLTTTRVGWRWVDSRGLELPSQNFQTNFSNEFHQNENKCFVAFGVVGERRVGAERVKFNLGVHGCF